MRDIIVEIVEHIPDHIEVVEVAGDGIYDADQQTISWSGASPLAASYTIRPLKSGNIETNGPSTVEFTDSRLRAGQDALPVGSIVVLGR